MIKTFCYGNSVYRKNIMVVFESKSKLNIDYSIINHIAISGFMENNSIGKSRYLFLLKDDYSYYRRAFYSKQVV